MNPSPFRLPEGWRVSDGAMAEFVKTMDWSATPLGPRADWSESLCIAVDLIMASAFPMALRWGPEFVLIYNEAYRPILGDKHPWAMGRPAREAWAEVWPQLEPGHIAILHGASPSVFADDILLRIQRHGDAWEDARFTLSYSPVPDPSAERGVGGILVTAVEITARIAAERALTESRSYLQDILNSSGEAFYALDREGVTRLCNKAFLRLMGFEREEDAVGRKLHDVIHHSHPDGAPYPVADCPIYQSASTGEPRHVDDEVFFRLSGEAFPVEYWVRPIYRGGVHEGAICTFIDIRERRAAQEALAESEAQFRTLAQAMPNHVWTAAPDGLLDWFNDRVYDYSGMARGSLDGEGWIATIHPDDVEPTAGRWADALASGDAYETEFRLRRADGVFRWHLARAVAVRGADGEITRWIGTNTDIEDQKTTAEALAELNANLAARVAEQAAERDRLWQTSQDLLAVLDAGGVFKAVNPAWTTVLGWKPKELVGTDHRRLVHPEDWEAEQAIVHLPRPLPTHENRVLCKSGEYRWISWVASSENGLVYATGRDVTAEKAAEAELALAQEALRQSQKMEAVGQLTGGIAHDFNNMLAVVIGSLDLLARRLGGDERALRYVDAASDGARRAALLTQRLLSFSRQQPLEPKPINLNTLVAGMSDLLSHSIGADIRLETVLAGGLWRVEVDPNQLENVILNLVVNARDAMPDGGRLTIETQNTHLDDRYAATHDGVAAGQYVMLAVTDTGGGMPEAVIAKAFDPFFTTKAVGKGTGLGLSQVYGFIKQSGGHVKIYSEPGHGTTVKIYLARLHGAIVEDLPPPPSSAHAAGDRGTVLVVEDEPGVRAFTTEALTELGYTVLAAQDGAAALRLLDSHPEVDVLFTDVVMPDMNGRRLADEALARRPDLKVLFTTGYTRNAVVHNGVLDKEVALIGKPFTVEALAHKLREVLG
jgi:PAS domain S-box-containing protein